MKSIDELWDCGVHGKSIPMSAMWRLPWQGRSREIAVTAGVDWPSEERDGGLQPMVEHLFPNRLVD